MSKKKPQVKKFDLNTASIEELERKIKELREDQMTVKKAGGGVIKVKRRGTFKGTF